MEVHKNILMVEDEVSVMSVNRRMLKRRGYDLQEAKNAKEAYEFLDHTLPDLLILDIMLPDGNGYDICSYFRQKSDNPVIFLTGKTEITDKVEGLARGCDYYLTKPYSFDELLAVVQRLLSRTDKQNEQKIVIGNLVIDLHLSKVFLDGTDVELTKTEFIMLKTLVENQNREMTADELYEIIWQKPSAGDTRNIRKHIMNLRNKIHAEESQSFDLFTSYGKGYTFTIY